jgi:hypothetical protein
MPGAKFVFPTNFDTTLNANTEFTIKMNVVRMKTGVFANSRTVGLVPFCMDVN